MLLTKMSHIVLSDNYLKLSFPAGTASVAVAGVFAALKITKNQLLNHTFVFQGAGEVSGAKLGLSADDHFETSIKRRPLQTEMCSCCFLTRLLWALLTYL